MRLRRRASVLAAAMVLLLGAAACGADDEPTTKPKTEPTETTSASPTESSSPTEPAWEDNYTNKQLAAYEAALTRWETYESRSEPIWAAGKVTERAEALFQQYFPSPIWQTRYRTLKSYEQAEVKIEGTAAVSWSKPLRVTKSARSVLIHQCVDFSKVRTTQDGEPVKGNRWTTTPHIREIALAKPKGYDWLIYSYGDPKGRKLSCTP